VEHTITTYDGLRLVADVSGTATDRSPVLCLPGLTRNARDFTVLAAMLSVDRLVVAFDLRGRGRSDRDPTAQSYTLATYARDSLDLCDALGLDRAVWIGTSLGGLVSMHAGSMAPERLAGLVLNDIGPELAPEGLTRIQSYAGKQEPLESWEVVVREVHLTSGAQTPGLSDQEWLEQAHNRYRETPEGKIIPDYDQAIVDGPASEVDPWWVFDRLTGLPLLVLRGEFSDLLSLETVQTMQALHPEMRFVEVPNRGHAPLLNEPAAAAALTEFLDNIDRHR
jgi:pimeloyl-ACP methyl ester carboxylesterase